MQEVVRPNPLVYKGIRAIQSLRMNVALPPGDTVQEAIGLTGLSERSIRYKVADGTLDVIRRGRRIYLTRESVQRLRDDVRAARRHPFPDLSEADRDLIRDQVRSMAAMTPEQLNALGTLLAEIRLTHAAALADARTKTPA